MRRLVPNVVKHLLFIHDPHSVRLLISYPNGSVILAAESQPVYTLPPADGAMQLLKVARDRPGAPSSSQLDKGAVFECFG